MNEASAMTMFRTTVALCAATILLSGTASAQKLYRWVDKDGKVHISDQLPPEAVNQARQEFNTKTGSTIARVDRALTAEERAQLEAERAAAAKAAEDAEALKRLEESMMANYDTEEQLRRAYEERITLVKTNAEATEISIRSQKATLVTLLSDAAEAELSNRALPGDRSAVIRQMHDQIVKLQQLQVRQAAAQQAVDQEFERVLARYRELKGQAGAPGVATPAPETP